MRYAHNVARGYDDRAATTRALMCLPAGMMELVRPESMRPQTSQRSVLGADTSAATRGVRERRQDGGETTSKTPQLPRVASVALRGGRSLPRAFLGWESRDCTRARDGGRFAFWQAAVLLPQLCFIAAVARFRTVLLWFVQRSATQGDTVRTQHKKQTAALGFEAAAQRIKADICGSALPITRKEAKQ